MDHAEYEKMYSLEQSYWWFQGRKRIVMTLLDPLLDGATRPRHFDYGCGTGLLLDEMGKRADSLGVDFSAQALKFCRDRDLRKLVQADVTQIPFRSGSADIVTALDIAEHVSDDGAFLDEIARTLRPGGRALLTVPAHPFLWSEHDESLWHHRRYRRKDLHDLIAARPFKIHRLTYAITFTFVPIVLYRLAQRRLSLRRSKPKTHLVVLPRWINAILKGMLHLEARLLKHINLPVGVSLVALLERLPDDPKSS